jgi:hypothetical protein
MLRKGTGRKCSDDFSDLIDEESKRLNEDGVSENLKMIEKYIIE